jgi:2-C-methyl-D-erythritol 2,4-cyclodiphosphate synthase
MRIGQGFDVHAFESGRKLMLGCVEVPHESGLAGHSDADVMAHALCDALLGAAALGDIGQTFPDSDPQWKGAAGSELLRLTMEKVRAKGFELVNADLTLMGEAPKIALYREKMIQAMAQALSVDPGQINVKATTTEGLGFIGRKQGLASSAVVLITRPKA